MVFAATVVYNGLELLPHFLRHYRQLGVDRILVAVQESIWREASEIAAQFDAWTFPFHRDRFDCLDKHAMEERILFLANVRPDDYVLYLDLDEFQEYPAPLEEIIAQMDERNLWAVRGRLIDRISNDGSLNTVRPEPSIWEQFPIKSRITSGLLRGWDQKIMVCRGRVRLNSGHHDTENAYYDEVPVAGEYLVHHFKWHSDALKWTRSKLVGGVSDCYRSELEEFLRHCDELGKFDLSDGRLGIFA